ncbi:MAG: phosphoribosylanthranilate isomerase [Chloroflexi bacterium]|nr:MAG: phosphoribosylanthranilate isomerase [Chloroflexota bacterium]
MTYVKICGNRTPDDVLAAAEAGADFVGMIFANSSRHVDLEDAQAMVRALGGPLAQQEIFAPPPSLVHGREELEPWFRHGAQVLTAYLGMKRPLTVGVFADQPIEEVNELAEEAGVDLVQLSGDETWEDCLRVAKQVIQVRHIGPVDTPADPLEDVRPGFAVALMLDTAHTQYRGGTGQVFDWDVATRMAARLPIVLAGGLTPLNVTEAVARVRPWAVDVASGTETDGRKDYAKVRAFVQAVRAADAGGVR